MYKIILPTLMVITLAFGFFIVKDKIITPPPTPSLDQTTIVQTTKEGCGEDCKKIIAEEISKAVATLSGSTKTIIQTATPAVTAQPRLIITPTTRPQDSYITIAGSGSTQNMNWTDVPGTDFSFDTNRDFSSGARFAWEGFLRITNANGKAFARIYDATHGIGVDGSEITITNVADYTRAVSTNMNFWAGRNVYRVQIKSLNTVNVDYMGGKIRVSY